jgi:allantoicase
VLELARRARRGIAVDTAHFKGNYPDRCFLQAAPEASGSPEEIAAASESWPLLLPRSEARSGQGARLRDNVADLGDIRFVRLNIIPDGGISRLRLVGRARR